MDTGDDIYEFKSNALVILEDYNYDNEATDTGSDSVSLDAFFPLSDSMQYESDSSVQHSAKQDGDTFETDDESGDNHDDSSSSLSSSSYFTPLPTDVEETKQSPDSVSQNCTQKVIELLHSSTPQQTNPQSKSAESQQASPQSIVQHRTKKISLQSQMKVICKFMFYK